MTLVYPIPPDLKSLSHALSWKSRNIQKTFSTSWIMNFSIILFLVPISYFQVGDIIILSFILSSPSFQYIFSSIYSLILYPFSVSTIKKVFLLVVFQFECIFFCWHKYIFWHKQIRQWQFPKSKNLHTCYRKLFSLLTNVPCS